MPSSSPPEILGLAQRSAAMAAGRRAWSKRSPCRRARAAGREAAEPGLVPLGGASTRRRCQRPPKFGRRSRRLLQGRTGSRCRDLLGDAGRCARIPDCRSHRRRPTISSRDGPGLDFCSCAPATALVRRSPRPSSSTDRPAPSRHAAPAATPSRCTRTRCGSWLSAVSTSAGRPTKSLTRFARTRFDRVITLLRQGARDLPGVPRGADRRALEHRRSRRRRRQRRGDVPGGRADEIESRVALLLRPENPKGPPCLTPTP